MAAYSEFSVTATDLKPRGSRVSLSPCEFQTCSVFGRFANSGQDDRCHPQPPFAVFAFEALLDPAAEKLGEQLHAVADAKHRHAELKDFFVGQRRFRGIHAGWAAGQDDAPGFQRGDFLRGCVEAQDLRIHVALANAARNDLRVLRAEIKNDNLFVHEIKNRNALFACATRFWRAKNVFARRRPSGVSEWTTLHCHERKIQL